MSLIISPHLDDAILGLGQFAAAERPMILTVFAGIPDETLTPYDEACGFTSSRDAMRHRREEDRAACRICDTRALHLDFLDGQYGRPTDDETLTTELKQFFSPHYQTFIPLGIGHPDHEQVARCARAACPSGEGFLAYEELPYRVLHPEQVADALDKIRADGFAVAELPHPIEQGEREQKAAAIACYRSQFPDGADDPCLLVPERCWQIRKLHAIERCA